MKKVLIHIWLIVTFIIIYLLQTIFFTHFTIAGIMPNIFIILMLYIGLYMGRMMGIIYGISFGILMDMWMGRSFGLTSIGLALIGLLSGTFDKTLSKDSRMIVLIMGAICTILYEIIMYLLNYMFLKILLIEVIYNVLLIIILYPLMKLTGYEIENEIKGDRILTRYF